MSNIIFSRLERVYLNVDPAFASDGTIAIGSFGNTNYCRHIKVELDNEIATLVRRDKTGARTATVGVRGRSSAKWSYEGSLAPSGTLGSTADFDPIMQAIFNGPAVSGASPGSGVGTALVYGPFVDQPNKTFSMASFRQPSSVRQRIGFGLTVDEATFNLGADIAEWTANGTGKFVIDSEYFDSASTDEKGGLGSFPTEPGAPVSHGGIIAGFTGSFRLNGAVVGRIRTAQIKIKNGNVMVKDTFSHYTPDDTMGDTRMVTLQATMYEDDSAGQQALRVASTTKTPVDADITLGTVSGSIVNFYLKNVQLAAFTTDDSSLRYSNTIPESRAFGTNITSRDECTISLA